MSHLNTEDLVAYVEGRLATQALHLVKGHLATCVSCETEFKTWGDLFSVMRGTLLQDPPEQAVRNCLAIYRIEKPVSRLRQVIASLVFDSFQQPQMVGVRGVSEAQQLLMQGDGLDLHLRVSYAPRSIVGSLMQRSDERFVSGARLSILKDGVTVETTTTDSLGEFRFQQAPDGALQVQADLPTSVRLLGEFTVRGE